MAEAAQLFVMVGGDRSAYERAAPVLDAMTKGHVLLGPSGAGAAMKLAVNAVDEGVLAGWRWVYFSDPDGYPLELVEVAYYNEDERREGIAAYLASR